MNAIFVGPIVSRKGGFVFDTFSQSEGLTAGFPYRCVEQADYDRKRTLRRPPQGVPVVACDTVSEFQRRCGERSGAAIAA